MQEPFLYKSADSINWSFSQVVELVQDITQLECLDELVVEADRSDVFVQVPPETINFVKRFLFHHGHHKTSERASNLIRSGSCLPTPQPPDGGPPVFPPPTGPNNPGPL
jgi:hypothetical protein